MKGSHNTDEIMYTIAITLVVAGSLCYHVCNRSIDPRIAAPVSIAATYLFALIIVALPIAVEQRASRSAIASAGYVNWATGLVVGALSHRGIGAGSGLPYVAPSLADSLTPLCGLRR